MLNQIDWKKIFVLRPSPFRGVTYYATAVGKEEKNKKSKSKPNESSTAEPASRMACFPVLFVLLRGQ